MVKDLFERIQNNGFRREMGFHRPKDILFFLN
jgi:hypothetical protein